MTEKDILSSSPDSSLHVDRQHITSRVGRGGAGEEGGATVLLPVSPPQGVGGLLTRSPFIRMEAGVDD